MLLRARTTACSRAGSGSACLAKHVSKLPRGYYKACREPASVVCHGIADRRAVILAPGLLAASAALDALSPSQAKATKAKAPPTPADVVADIISHCDKGDLDFVMGKQAKDVVWKLPVGYKGDPLGGEFKGKYRVLTLLTRRGAALKDVSRSGLRLMQGDGPDLVVAKYKMKAQHAKTGKKYGLDVTEVWRVKEGEVTSLTAYYEPGPYAKAAGVSSASTA